MSDVFVKKYWQENGGIMFYYHFEDGWAVRQIEISQGNTVRLSLENPTQGESMLADQPLSEADLEERDFISKEEFEAAWNSKD